MKKNLYDIMKRQIEETLEGKQLELLSLSEGETQDKENGQIQKFIRCEAEVPKGANPFARCRFSVKIPNGKLKLSEKELENDDFFVVFQGLSVSYIDSKGMVYFRAESYAVKREGEKNG